MNQPNEYLQNSLYLMIEQNNLPGFNGLLLAGADPRIPDQEGNTILHQAIVHGHVQLLEVLLNDYSDLLNTSNASDLTPLNLAIAHQNLECLDVILTGGLEAVLIPNEVEGYANPDMLAQEKGIQEVFNVVEQFNHPQWPLAQAVLLDWVEGVNRLVQAGADLERVDRDGRTVLHLAALEGKEAAMSSLLGHSANREALDNDGYTALELTKQAGNEALKALLLDELDPIERRFSLLEDRLAEQSALLERHKLLLNKQTEMINNLSSSVEETNHLKYMLNAHVRFYKQPSSYKYQSVFAHTDPVESVAALADGRIASVTSGRVQIWNFDSGECLQIAQYRAAHFVAALPDGRVVSGSSQDRFLRIWNPDSGECLQTLEYHKSGFGFSAIAVLPDGRVASSHSNKTVCIWNSENGECLQILTEPNHWVRSVAALPDGRVVGVSEDTIHVWDPDSGQLLKTWEKKEFGYCYRAVALPDGRVVSGDDYDRRVYVWDLDSGQCLQTLNVQGAVLGLDALADGRVVIGSGNTVRVWDPDGRYPMEILRGHTGRVRSIALTSDGRVVSGSEDNTIRVWGVNELQLNLTIDKDKVEEIARVSSCQIN